MKIAFMSSGSIKGGLSLRPVAMAKQLQKRGHDVYIFAPRFDKYSKFKDELITEIDGIKIMRPWQSKIFPFELGLIPYMLSSIFMLTKLNPDIIHIYKPTPITITPLIINFFKKTPIVFDSDDLDSEVMKIENNPKLKIKLVEFSETLAAKNADAILAASKYLQNFYRAKYKKTKIIKHVPNGAEFINVKKINTENLSSNRIVFVGAINRASILEPLFYALKDLKEQKKEISAIIIGDGTYLDYFKDLAKQFKLTKTIKFLGWIPQNQLYKYIRAGDIGYCYLPDELTTRACSSMKVFQYMRFGAVPLVSNVGDLPFYTFQGKGGYIARHSDVKNLVEAIIEAIGSKNKNKAKIKYVQNHAADKFSWRVRTDDIEKIYKKLLKN